MRLPATYIRPIAGVITAVVLAALASCDSLGPSGWLVEMGIVPTDLQVIDAPDTVSVNEWFQSTITTYGSGNCTRAAGAAVTFQPLLVAIVPYDSIPDGTGDYVCNHDFGPHPRSVQVRFTAVGVGTIRVSGRSPRGDTVAVVEQAITVQ